MKIYVTTLVEIRGLAALVEECRKQGVEPRSLAGAISFFVNSFGDEIEEERAKEILVSVRGIGALKTAKEVRSSRTTTLGRTAMPFLKQSQFEKDVNRIMLGEMTPEEQKKYDEAMEILGKKEE